MTQLEDQEAGWWPVLVLTFSDAAMETIRPRAAPGFRFILLCCFYQVIATDHYAWWNEIPIWRY